jgi:hypothetical protein
MSNGSSPTLARFAAAAAAFEADHGPPRISGGRSPRWQSLRAVVPGLVFFSAFPLTLLGTPSPRLSSGLSPSGWHDILVSPLTKEGTAAGVGLSKEIMAAARNSIPGCIGHGQRQEGVEDGAGGVGKVRAEVIWILCRGCGGIGPQSCMRISNSSGKILVFFLGNSRFSCTCSALHLPHRRHRGG